MIQLLSDSEYTYSGRDVVIENVDHHLIGIEDHGVHNGILDLIEDAFSSEVGCALVAEK